MQFAANVKKELDPKYRVGGNVYNCPNCGLEESIK